MHISLDNISFYSHPPPTKSPPRAFPISRWKPYETPLAPQALSHTPLPRLPSPRTTTTLASDAKPNASPEFRAPARGDPDLRAVPNEFDIEIERMAMAENGPVAHEADLDIHCDSGLVNGTVTDVPQSQRTSLATGHPDRHPLLEAASDSDPACMPAEPDLRYFRPAIAPTDSLDLPRDSTASLRTYSESDKDPTPPEIRFACERISPLPSPGSLGSPNPQAEPNREAFICDESVVDDAETGTESCGDRGGDPIDGLTIQRVQIHGPSVRETSPDNDERGRLTEESQTPASPRLRPRTRPAEQLKVPLTSTRSLRPRPHTRPTRSERLPAVSVVIPTRRTNRLVANTKMNPPSRAQRYEYWGGRNNSNLINDQPTRAVTAGYSPLSGVSSPKARGRPRKRTKRAMGNTKASTNDIVGNSANQSQTPLDNGFAATLGETQEIFGRGVLRIQSHGPRNAYFMTFLPEVSQLPSPPSPSKMPPDQSSLADDNSKDESLPQVVRGRPHKRTVPTACEDGDVRSTRHSTKSSPNSRSQDYRNEAQRKPRRRLPWSSDEVDFLLKLRRDEGRPWSEVARLFLDRYPGRSPGSIQVYWSTAIKKARQSMVIGAST